MERGIGLNNQRKWQFGLLEQRMCGRYSVQGRSDIFWRTIRVRRGSNTGLRKSIYMKRKFTLIHSHLVVIWQVVEGSRALER